MQATLNWFALSLIALSGCSPRAPVAVLPQAKSGDLDASRVLIQGILLNPGGSVRQGAALQLFTPENQTFGILTPERSLVGRCTSDQRGHFSTSISSEIVSLLVGFEEDGRIWFPWGLISVRETAFHLGILRLPELKTVRGTLLDSDGQPASGWTVRLSESEDVLRLVPPGFLISEYDDIGWTFDSAGDSHPGPDSGVLETTADHDGGFSFVGRFRDPLICYIDSAGIPHSQGCGSARGWSSITVRAHSLDHVEFRFQYEKGEPAEGAQAAVPVSSCWPDFVLLKPMHIASAQGTVSFATETPSICTAAMRRTEADPWFVRSDLYQEGVPRLLALPDPRPLEIHVFDLQGRPITGATVRGPGPDNPYSFPAAGIRHEHESLWQETSEGTYRSTPAAHGNEIGATIEAPGKALGMISWDPLDETRYLVTEEWNEIREVELHDARRLLVKVVSAGEPVANALIQTGSWLRWSSDEPRCQIHGELSAYFPKIGMTDAKGSWDAGELCSQGETIRIRVGASIHTAEWDGGISEFTVEVGPISVLQGAVQNHRQPLAHALLSLEDDRRNSHFFYSDEQGRFETRLLTGTYVLRVQPAEAGRWGPLVYARGLQVVDGADQDLNIQLATAWTMPTATIHGQLWLDGEPFTGWLHFNCAPGENGWRTMPTPNVMFWEELRAHAESSSARLQFPLSFALPVLAGKIEPVKVPSGAVAARLFSDGETIFQQRPLLYSGVLQEGQVLNLSTRIVPGLLKVEFVDTKGQLLAGARVTVCRIHPEDDRPIWMTTDMNGTCELRLEPGSYQVAATFGQGSSYPPVTQPNSWSNAARVEESITIKSAQTSLVRLMWE